MEGQWIGEWNGKFQRKGIIFVNIVEEDDKYKINIYFNYLNNDSAGYGLSFCKSKPLKDFIQNSELKLVNPINSEFDEWNKVNTTYENWGKPKITLPRSAKLSAKFDDEKLILDLSVCEEISFSCQLEKSSIESPSVLEAKDLDWSEFKREVLELKPKKFIYRGQEKPRKLITSFHRTGRLNLMRYRLEDINELHERLTSQTRHFFDLADNNQNGAFFNLLQHHGYPTTLLDWSESPYVAAYFAYRRILKEESQKDNSVDKKVRIFLFDVDSWNKDIKDQSVNMVSVKPNFARLHLFAIENSRMIPQQAISFLSNLVDIEKYIFLQEKFRGKKYLSAIDLPVSDRIKVMNELAYMGITAGALFPGLDGTCEELKEKNFNI